MNLHTFKDAVTDKRQALANDIEDDDDDDDTGVGKLAEEVEGEEEEGVDKVFNDIGEVLEPFNLRDEREGGHFDENMNYVWSKEPTEPDAWLADMDEAAMEKSIGEAAEAMKAKNIRDESFHYAEQRPQHELKLELLKILLPGENIMQSLRRLGGKKNNNVSHGVKKRTKSGAKEKNEAKSADVEAINKVTEIADQLVSSGLAGSFWNNPQQSIDLRNPCLLLLSFCRVHKHISGIYQMSYEALQASLVMWEYLGKDGTIYGPFTSKQISDWKNSGYFAGESAVMIRKVNGAIIPKANPDLGKSTSSSHDNSLLMKKRKESDTMNNESESKRTKSSNVGMNAKETSLQDLIDDLNDQEDEDVDENTAGRQGVANANTVDGEGRSVTSIIIGSEETKSSSEETFIKSDVKEEPWMSSDEIDFGEFLEVSTEDNLGNNENLVEDDDINEES